MKKFINKLIKQYITCKHGDYALIRKIICDFEHQKPKWLERRKCKICGREYYSDYFYEYGNDRHYTKN